MAKAKRTIYYVAYKGGFKLPWVILLASTVLDTFKTQAEAVAEARRLAKEHEPSQVKIKGKSGQIQREWTYPRKSDPRETKG